MPTREQQEALSTLRSRYQVDRTIWPGDADCPRFLYGRLSPATQLAPEVIVERFLSRHGAIYGLGKAREHRVIIIKQDTAGNRHVEIERTAGQYRIAPTRMSFWIDATGAIRRIKAHWPLVPKPQRVRVKIDADQALEAAAATRKKARLRGFASKPSLEYRLVPAASRRRTPTLVLAWNFVARFGGARPATEGFVVSAVDGTVLLRYPDEDEVAATTTGIGINDADETSVTPARTIDVDDPGGGAALTLLDTTRTPNIQTQDMATATSTSVAYSLCADDDGDGAFNDITNAPRSDSNRPEVDAHYNTGLIHDYYARAVTVNAISLFGRDGWNDDVAEPWINLVHYSVDSQSSAFTRTDRVTYHGDGDGTNLTYKPTLDTCSHEWAHGVQMTEVTGGTNPNGGFDGTPGENFILKEAMSDMVAASLARDSGWRMGAVFEDDAAMAGATHGSTGNRLRGLQQPSDFGQPDHYYATADTSGLGYAGVAQDYTRIGILDKAAFLIAMGGTHPSAAPDPITYPPIPVYGLGVVKFENILDYTLNQLSGPADLFLDFRQDMIAAADALYPGGCESSTVANAFDAVGVYETGSTPPARPAGPDPMIAPWGARTDDPPYWQTPDIYVKDAADNLAAPLKGQVNRLFALVTNIGDADAIGVSVSFLVRALRRRHQQQHERGDRHGHRRRPAGHGGGGRGGLGPHRLDRRQRGHLAIAVRRLRSLLRQGGHCLRRRRRSLQQFRPEQLRQRGRCRRRRRWRDPFRDREPRTGAALDRGAPRQPVASQLDRGARPRRRRAQPCPRPPRGSQGQSGHSAVARSRPRSSGAPDAGW